MSTSKRGNYSKYCTIGKIQIKEDEKDYHVSGLVATSHPDRSQEGDFAGDIIPRSTLAKIVEQINNRFKPEAGAVSESHDYIKAEEDLPLAGVTVGEEPAKLIQLEDGEWGVSVETVLSKTNPRYEEVKTNIEQGIYPGFSIEYSDTKFVPTEKEGKMFRMLTDLEMEGFGFANRRLIANPHAEITTFGYKEIMKVKGDSKMEEKIEVKEEEKKEEAPEASKEAPVEPNKEEAKEEPKEEAKEMKEISEEDAALLKEIKERKEREAKLKEIEPLVKERIKSEMKARGFKDAPIKTNEEKTEFKELEGYKAALAESKELDKPVEQVAHRHTAWKRGIEKQYKEAAKLYNTVVAKGIDPYKNGQLGLTAEQKEIEFETYDSRIEMKEFKRIEVKAGEGGQVDTNLADSSWTYGSYYLSPVELNDIFQPVLVNQLNDQTMTFGRLQKENWAGRSQIQFRARTGRNSTAGGYSEGANLTYGTSFTGTVGRDKYQQPFSYYRVLVAVTGQAQRFAMAPGGMGDRWADEVKWSGTDLAVTLNQAVLGTGDGTSEATALGFEGLFLGTSGTLYGKTLGTAATSTLHSHQENMSSARVTLDQLRKMIRLVSIGSGSGATQVHSSAQLGNLVFFCNHLQKDFVKALIQDMQRILNTSARAGFEGEVEFDGVPIVADKDINTDDIFLVDTSVTKIGMNLPPTLEPLPVTADAQAAQVKTYFNLYSAQPGNNYWAYGFATS
ncbi:MAG: hypothetical protein CMH64_01725 [Nanoarchaeota archaeon]|jgi:hypothetical protein|nr:hypothetical protein [Nanoarchaeota archaeon]|tara:strand:- start:243 stop:2432 length:2190 start_codon:yes stop_codon:yes gene_type:complete